MYSALPYVNEVVNSELLLLDCMCVCVCVCLCVCVCACVCVCVRDGTILNITESMQYYTIRYCYRLYIALDDNIEKAVISLVL